MDSSGNPCEPFIIDGTAYLPLRGIATVLGISAHWDDATSTISLTRDGQTTFASSSPQETLIMDREGIQVYYRGITSDDERWHINLRIVNNSGYDITVQTRDKSVNGVMVDPYFSPGIANGKTGIESIRYYKSDLEKVGITGVENSEFKFRVFSDGDVVDFETEPIAVN